MKTLGIIPARGGSKGVARKNVRRVAGKPLIVYTISAALNATSLDFVVVSTDDEEIAELARAHGAEVPFMRPKELATDTASSADVALHCLAQVEASKGVVFDAVALLQPTTPLRTHEEINAGVHLLQANPEAQTVITVTPVGAHHPYCMYVRAEQPQTFDAFLGASNLGTRRQDFPDMFIRVGSLYVVRRNFLIQQRALMSPRTLAVVVPVEHSLNIDNEFDLSIAECLLGQRAG